MASTSSQHPELDGADGGQHQQAGEIDESQFTTAPICLVLTEDVHKIFEKGDPLIVGTSMLDIQIFFQKVIAEAQVGFEGASSSRPVPPLVKATSAGVVDAPPVKDERYPVPSGFIRRAKPLKPRKPRVVAEEVDIVADTEGDPEEEEERCEIPVEAIKYYLTEKKYYPGWTANAKRNLRKRCDDFEVADGQLCYKTKKGSLAICVDDPAERIRLLWETHAVDHRRRDRLFKTMRDQYYWKGMLNDVNKILESCEHCSHHRDTRSALIQSNARLAKRRSAAERGTADERREKRRRRGEDAPESFPTVSAGEEVADEEDVAVGAAEEATEDNSAATGATEVLSSDGLPA